MFDIDEKSLHFSSPKKDSQTSHGRLGVLPMEVKVTVACIILLTLFPTFGISTSSNQCNATQICSGGNAQNTSGFSSNITDCCKNSSVVTSATKIMESPSEPSTMSTRLNTFANLNGLRSCFNDSVCINSSDYKCLSVKCVTQRQSSDKSTRKCSCASLACGDGRCYNLTVLNGPTIRPTKTPEEGITPLQLVLLFGSMGGIFVFILIVYCVKTFKDTRTRQYLLKHGVWDTPPDDKLKESSGEEEKELKTEGSRPEYKLDVPTIKVQMENEISKSKESGIETVEDAEKEDLESATTEKVMKPRLGKIIHPEIIQVRGYAPIPSPPSESSCHEHANLNHSTKEPNSEKTKPQETIEAPTGVNENNKPTPWNKDLAKAPLTESPKRNRFPALIKSKDPPKKIMANGTPEKSPKLNSKRRNPASPPQLVEPENFSDFGM